jgi:hypothetical protein
VTAARGPLADVARYYNAKVLAFGATALGVDWPSLPALHARLRKLLEVGELVPGTSLNDLGCGWGAALDIIEHFHRDTGVDYWGIDIAPAMIDAACARWVHRPGTQFSLGSHCPRAADYAIASGIFNVKLERSRADWEQHVQNTLLDMHRHSRKGFAVNFMRPLPGARDVPELYRTEPEPWVRFCESAMQRSVDVTSLEGLAEFTLLVR